MKVSLNWIKQYLDFELPPVDELVKRIGAQLGAVEEVENLGAKYQGIFIVKVVSCEDHPDADRLHVCKIDDGGKAQNVERDENGHVQVVCGAPNVHADMVAVWLPPGSTVPESYGKTDPFVLEARELRGVVSNGMLASPRELALGESHDGILDLSGESVTPSDLSLEPGADFAAVYDLNDYIIDIENKMFTHRPDCFGQLGVAREIAGIFGRQFTSPEQYRVLSQAAAGSGLDIKVTNEIPEKVPRFITAAVKGVSVKPSPFWLQVELYRVGSKPISNIVDVTNYVMLLTGQPMHAYDYDKVASGELGVRYAKAGERLALLNGKTIELDEADIVITDGTKPIGLGGVMGGSETEVSEETKCVILECATFDMYTIRRTSMRHGLFTDAVTRFNKGQSPLQNPYVTQLALGHVHTLASGELASPVIDDDYTEGRVHVHPPVPVSTGFINARLGLNLSANEMATLLNNVEFDILLSEDEKSLTVSAPYWRTDIEMREDVVEEIGRLYGYDRLPLELPERSIRPVRKDAELETKARARDALSRAGANELLTYSFVHGNLLDKVGQQRDQAFQLSNALSPELQYYRQSILPSLLDKVHPNLKAGYDEFALFEIGKGHNLQHANDNDGLPSEFTMVSLVYAASDKCRRRGAPFYQARAYLDALARAFDLELSYEKISEDPNVPVSAPYDWTRSAFATTDSGKFLGIVGEFTPKVLKNLKLPAATAGFSVGMDELILAASRASKKYDPLPRFPSVTQDICLKVGSDIAYQALADFVEQQVNAEAAEQMRSKLTPIDIYQREDDHEHKQVTFRLVVANYERTLTDTEVNALLDKIAQTAKDKFGAERV